MFRTLSYAMLAGLAALAATPAQAKWYRASSDHFVVYADDDARDVKRFSDMLERYHSAMELLTGKKIAVPSPSNRVTIYAVGSVRDVQKLMGDTSKMLAGIYLPRASGSIAFVPDIKMAKGETDFQTIVLLHEYAHHFLISSSRFEMPRWMGEGAAEYFASARFFDNGEVEIGRPAYHRGAELVYADSVPIRALLDEDTYAKRKSKRDDSFYGRSWLLYHYLSFDPARKGQLIAYARALAAGKKPIDAAEQVFGDLKTLESDLNKYQRASRMMNYKLKADMTSTGPVDIVALSPGMNEALPLIAVSKRGVTREQALELLPRMQKIAVAFPDDADVLGALAEAEHDAGNDAAAIAVADRAIAIDPTTKNAYVQKGYSLFRLAENANNKDSAYKAAMAPFAQLNKLEPDNVLPLIYYYRSFTEVGDEPPEHARHAIERAAELAPFDKGLWMTVGVMQAHEGKIRLAIDSFGPVAADPHGEAMATAAQTYLEQLKNAPEGTPFDIDFSSDDEAAPDATGGTGTDSGEHFR